MHLAIMERSIEDVKGFLESGVDVNTLDDSERDLLMLAVTNSFNTSTDRYDTDIIKLLLSKGAKVNTKDINGETALFKGKIETAFYELRIP